MGETKGALLMSSSAVPEMRRRRRRWARMYLFFGLFLVVLVAYVDLVLLVFIPVSPLGVLTAILVTALFVPLGISTALDAFAWSFLEVYEKGVVLPQRRIRDLLAGKKEYFVPFSAIKAVITNPRFKAPNIALYVGDEEVLVDKRDVYDLDTFERLLRERVGHVWAAPPPDEVLDKVLEAGGPRASE